MSSGISTREFHKLYWDVLKPFRVRAGLAVTLGGIAGFLELLTLLVVAPVLGLDMGWQSEGVANSYLSMFSVGGPFANPWIQFSLLVTTAALSGCMRWLAGKSFVSLRFDIVLELRRYLLDRLLRMKWERHHTIAGGSISNSIMTAVWHIGEGVEQYLYVLISALILCVLLGSAAVVAPGLALMAAGYSLIVITASFLIARKASYWSAKSVDQTEEVAIISQKVFDNLKFIRVSGFEQWAREALAKSFDDNKKGYTKNVRLGELHHYAVELAGIVCIGLLIVVYRTSDSIAFGTFILFMGLFYRSLPRMQGLQASRYAAYARADWLKWWKALDERIGDSSVPLAESAQKNEIPGDTYEIVFDRVSFSYTLSCESVGQGTFENLSFVVPKGGLLALVGESGSGKSTVLDLMLGLIFPRHGQVLVNNIALDSFDLNEWRRNIGYLPQEPLLFSTSVIATVAFADPCPDRQKAEACLKAAQAWEFVVAMPEGLDSWIGERGGRLSGGEKQRLALARALYRDPKLLLLDEPTSALDEANAAKFREVLLGLKGFLTIVVITHQKTLMDIADEVIDLSALRTSSEPVPSDLLDESALLATRKAAYGDTECSR